MNEESNRWRCSDNMALMLDIGHKEPYRKDVPSASGRLIVTSWHCVNHFKPIMCHRRFKPPQTNVQQRTTYLLFSRLFSVKRFHFFVFKGDITSSDQVSLLFMKTLE